MKIFINTTTWAIVKQENETPILVGNNYVDQLKVYYDSNPSTQYFYPLLNILKPNDRKVGLISFDATSVEEPNPSTYTDDEGATWYMFKFTLSSDNHQIDVSGKYQFTITTNYYNSTTGVILKQRNINAILSVVNAVTNDDNSVLILGDDPGEVVAELYALCQSLQTGVASLQISVSALQSGKADLNNPNQDIVAGSIKAENAYLEELISEYGAQIILDDVYGISFRPAGSIKYITIGDGKISGVDTVEEANDATNKYYVDTKDALKADLNNASQNIRANKLTIYDIIDGTDTTEIEMTLGAINIYAKNWENPSQYKTFIFSYDNGLQIDEPTKSYNPATKNFVETADALKFDKANVYNGLDKTADGFALDARQGKALKDSLDTLYNYVGYATENDEDTTINKLREIFQFLAGEADDTTLLSLLAGKQAKIDSDNKLDADLVDDTNATHKFVSASEKSQITTNQNDIAGIKDGTSIDSFADVEAALAAKQNVINNNNKLSSDLVDDATSSNKFVSQQERNQITANKNAIEEIEEAIPTKTSDLTNDSGFIDNTYHDDTKLDKVTTTTGVLQAYVKQTNGTQQMLDVHWNNVPDTLPIRDQTGNIRVALIPTNNTHAASKQYVDNAIASSGGGTALYNHSIKARFINNCYEEFDVIIKFQSSSNTQITTESAFKALFSEAISTDSENDSYNYRIIPFLNNTYIVDTSYQFVSGALKQVVLGYDTVNDCFTYTDDWNGPATFVTEGTITDTVTTA